MAAIITTLLAPLKGWVRGKIGGRLAAHGELLNRTEKSDARVRRVNVLMMKLTFSDPHSLSLN